MPLQRQCRLQIGDVEDSAQVDSGDGGPRGFSTRGKDHAVVMDFFEVAATGWDDGDASAAGRNLCDFVPGEDLNISFA